MVPEKYLFDSRLHCYPQRVPIGNKQKSLTFKFKKMKKTIISSMLVMACLLFGCQKDANFKPVAAGGPVVSGGGGGGGSTVTTPPASVATIPQTDTITSPLPIGSLIAVGTWKVTSYVERGLDDTQKFSSYTFTFSLSGAITANQSGKILNGTWLYLPAVFYYGIPIYGTSPDGFNISFGITRPLSLLGKNLFISKKTTTNFYLSSVNPTEDTHITFTKISN